MILYKMRFKPHKMHLAQLFSELLPLAMKLRQCNIFRSVCQEFCPQGGGVGVAGGGVVVRGRYYEIRSMSRR